jgi:hypothetical protein
LKCNPKKDIYWVNINIYEESKYLDTVKTKEFRAHKTYIHSKIEMKFFYKKQVWIKIKDS